MREYLKFIQESEAMEPTEEERRALARGEEETARGEVLRWRDRKNISHEVKLTKTAPKASI